MSWTNALISDCEYVQSMAQTKTGAEAKKLAAEAKALEEKIRAGRKPYDAEAQASRLMNSIQRMPSTTLGPPSDYRS